MNYIKWHQQVTMDGCDPGVLWKVRQAIIELKWRIMSMRDYTTAPSQYGRQYFSDPLLRDLDEMEGRVGRFTYEYHPYPIPKC